MKKKHRKAPAVRVPSHQIKKARAIDLMHEHGRCLALMHTVHGPRWFIIPGAEVSEETAEAIRKMPNVKAAADALFPGMSQTWRMG
jgi:hypothetical protein